MILILLGRDDDGQRTDEYKHFPDLFQNHSPEILATITLRNGEIDTELNVSIIFELLLFV